MSTGSTNRVRTCEASGSSTSPRRALPPARSLDLFDVAVTRALERSAAAVLPAGMLMRRAGLAVARLVQARHPLAKRVWVSAGPGGNGGDGLHAAADLARIGKEVCVFLLADEARLGEDATEGWRRCREAGVRFVPAEAEIETDVAIDALLGLGGFRRPEGPMLAAIQALNRQSAPVIAIDLPSGLAADTGSSESAAAVHADASLVLLTLKPGLFTASGRELAGDIWFDDLGVQPTAEHRPCARLSAPLDLLRARPHRGHNSHKGSFGDVLIIGGAAGMVGAARLAAHAAQGAGAGRTILSILDGQVPPGDISRPEWLWSAQAWNWDARRLAASTVVCGCGGGDAVVPVLPPLLEQAGALVLDADALNAIARDPALETLLSDRASRGQATVLTPHPLEAARLLRQNTAEVQADRLTAARTLSERMNCVVILKGSGTVISAPANLPVVNSTGNAVLASGGTGDVLAGWIGGLWAACRGSRGRETAVWDLAQRCAVAAVWLHGQAADSHPLQASRALDLVGVMREVAASSA